ncbi:MAG: ABC transporter ATP-binding protein [Actinobacteria bacterium]|jgi:putative ABC transport system ATP-binding protein|nr:ABC transporter ATP-binding protein [Actinomycetota bacterium]MCL6104655.1 ABC transporter ATP-binding protein [Actinomycetota bacterium]
MTTTIDDNSVMVSALYDLDKVSKTYIFGGTKVYALKEATLRIGSGEVVSIEGPSGSGKSTLLLLLGVLDNPSAGTIAFDGKNLTSARDAELTKMRRETIGYVFQQFNLIPTLSARDNVGIAMVPHHVSKAERDSRSTALLEQVGLGHRLDHLPSSLSGGEQQRVAIARALANKPRVIIADEPTGNLDSKSGGEIISLLTGLQKTDGVTIVIATHDEDISRHAYRKIRMKDGEIVDDVVLQSEQPNGNHGDKNA